MRGFRLRRKRRGPGFLIAAGLVTGCLGPVEVTEPLLWEGDLEPVPGASTPVAGSMAMVADEFNTQIGVGLEDAPADEELGWLVSTGSCDSVGERVGPAASFPPLSVDDEGTAEMETAVTGRLESDGSYVGQITGESDGSGEPLACVDFELQD